MLKIVLRFAICVLVMFLGASNFYYAQKSAVVSKDGKLAVMQLENVQIEAQSIGRLFSKLSLFYNIPIGLETALNDDEFATYNIDFKKGTLSDLLTQFVSQHNYYIWEIQDGVVYIFPKNNYRDVLLSELLETKISSFSVKEETSCWMFVESLVDTLEIESVLKANGTTYRERNFSGAYIPQVGRNFTLDVSNTALKSILNKVVKESPKAKFWHITRNSYDQTVFIGLEARHENFPIKNKKPVFPEIDF